jgi:hypothetical protein
MAKSKEIKRLISRSEGLHRRVGQLAEMQEEERLAFPSQLIAFIEKMPIEKAESAMLIDRLQRASSLEDLEKQKEIFSEILTDARAKIENGKIGEWQERVAEDAVNIRSRAKHAAAESADETELKGIQESFEREAAANAAELIREAEPPQDKEEDKIAAGCMRTLEKDPRAMRGYKAYLVEDWGMPPEVSPEVVQGTWKNSENGKTFEDFYQPWRSRDIKIHRIAEKLFANLEDRIQGNPFLLQEFVSGLQFQEKRLGDKSSTATLF